jgi:hypothetical protein
VVVVGDAVSDEDGRIVATRGFYIDLTDSVNVEVQQSISDELQAIVAHRRSGIVLPLDEVRPRCVLSVGVPILAPRGLAVLVSPLTTGPGQLETRHDSAATPHHPRRGPWPAAAVFVQQRLSCDGDSMLKAVNLR